MRINAYVLKDFNLAGDPEEQIKKGDVLLIPTDQFNDWEGVGLVRKATAKEISAAKPASGE